MQVSAFTDKILSTTIDVAGCKKISDGTEGLVGFIIGAPRIFSGRSLAR